MIESPLNFLSFKSLFAESSLDTIVDALEIARSSSKEVGMSELFKLHKYIAREVIMPDDSLQMFIAKTRAAKTYYLDHSAVCDEIIERWNS